MDVLKAYDEGIIPNNKEIFDSFLVADNKFKMYDDIVCSVSGGPIVTIC